MDLIRLRAVLGQADMAWLLSRLRKRLEAGKSVDGTLVLQHPSVGERVAFERIFGRVIRPGAPLRVPLTELSALLRDGGICPDLGQAVAELSGPLRYGAVRTAEAARWLARRQALEMQHPLLAPFLLTRRGRRVLRAAWSDHLGTILGRLAEALPVDGITVAELAARLAGDSHAFDRGRPVAVLALRLAAAVAGFDVAESTLDRRLVWASVGVLCDELSSPALVLNLSADGEGFVDEELRRHAAVGEPYRMSVRQLLRQRPKIGSQVVHVCENPSVLAAATVALGSACPPLVCTEGQPRSSVHLLLLQLAMTGVSLNYHGDFDWPGIHIGNLVMSRYGATPWLFAVDDYRSACGEVTLSLSGPMVEATWDMALAAAMVERGVAVHEEQVMGALVRWLSSASVRHL